jgi:dienelactone hydrolase
MLHGAPGDARGMEFAVRPLAEAGAVVLTLDAPFARRDPRAPLAFTRQDSVDLVQHVVDLQRAVDVLVARADVDPARLAGMGISHGGSVGALLAGVERGSRRTRSRSPTAGGGALHAPHRARMPTPAGADAAAWCAWYSAMEPLAATRFVARAAPAELLFLWGRQDPMARPRLAEGLWRAASAPKTARWYATGHSLPQASGDDVRAWLAARIGITPPPVFRGRARTSWGRTRAGAGSAIRSSCA